MSKPTDVSISFGSKKAAKHFMDWLEGQGEQDYWMWMEARESEEPTGDITAVRLDYDYDNHKITTVAGRLDNDE